MMEILDRLIAPIPKQPVEEVIVGVHSVLVKTADNCGIASTIKYCSPHENVRRAGKLEQLNLRQLAEYAQSGNLLEASIGMAAINSFYSTSIKAPKSINAKNIILEHSRQKTVGIIGHFPFLEKQKEHYKIYYIFEKQPNEGDLTEADIPKYLPTVDVAAITATAITNHTFAGILKYLPAESYNIMLGPTTPVSPILFEFGMDAVSGSFVENYDQVKKYVLQATPTRHLQGIKYITIFKEDYL